MPRSLTVMRNRLPVVAHQPQVDAERRPPLPDFECIALLRRLPFRYPARHVHCAERGELGHAPTLSDLHAQDIFELMDQALGTAGAADEEPFESNRARSRGAIVVDQALHDGGHRARKGDLLKLDRLSEDSGIQIFAGHDQLRANRWRRKSEAPCIGVKHRHNWQDYVARGETVHIRLQDHQSVQEIGPMGVEDALGSTGGPRCKAEACGRSTMTTQSAARVTMYSKSAL